MTSRAPRIEADRLHRPTRPVAEILLKAAVRLVLALLRWQELAQQRRRLLALDDRMLKDIGITRAEAMREGTPKSKADRARVQQVFNAWVRASSRPLCQVSMILALSVD